MADIFISYKSERRKAAEHLAKILERYGYSVWFDYHLVKGDDFADEIDRRIREAKAVVILWCTLAVQSPWVKREAALATRLGRAVPCKIEPCDLRVDFDGDDIIDLTSWNGAPRDHDLDKLLAGVAHRVGRAPQLQFDAMRQFEEDWRRYGAPSLKRFALEAPLEAQEAPQPVPVPAPGHALTPAERTWDRFGIGGSEDAEEIEAYIKQYEVSEPLWAVKAKKRLAAVQALLRERADAAKLEAMRRQAEESAQRLEMARQQETRYRAEGRIRIEAALVQPAGLEWFLPGAGKIEGFKDAEFAPQMVVVPAGSFMMGAPPGEPQRSDAEGPQHKVTFARPFAMGRYAVSFDEWDAAQRDKDWQAVTGRAARSPKDYGWGRTDRPAIDVDWDDAKAYTKWLSAKTGKDYRLPSEAEWEYACRAATATPFWWGSAITPEQANYDGNYVYAGGGQKGEYRQETLPVKSFEPNSWGLYQVHGNVWEWCEDVWHNSYIGAPTDGSAWTTEDGSRQRVLRGGSWYMYSQELRAASRSRLDTTYRDYGIGFRVARTLPPVS
jgi:formylglycine-generating enzyme required for sulfatase activity